MDENQCNSSELGSRNTVDLSMMIYEFHNSHNTYITIWVWQRQVRRKTRRLFRLFDQQ